MNIEQLKIQSGSSADLADAYALSGTPVGTDIGLVTNSIMYGKSSAGGGAFVELKVTPAGAAVTSIGDISAIDGQAVMAASIPVVIASDQSTIPVSISGVATAANQTTIIGHVDGIESLLTTISSDTSNISGSIQVEDEAYDGDKGGFALVARRRDSLSIETDTDGDVTGLNSTSKGELYVKHIDTIPVTQSGAWNVTVTGITEYTEDAALPANPVGGIMMARKQGILVESVSADNDAMALNVAENGALWVKLDANTLTVTGNVDIPPSTSSFPKVEDSASFTGDTGVPAMAVRKGTPANLSDTDGDYEMLQMSAGRLWVDASGVTLTVDSELPAAAALADDLSNPSTTSVGSLLSVFDGTTWDRVRSIDAFTTASASPQTGLLATIATDRRFTSVSLGTAVNSTQSWDVNGADSVVIHCGTSTTGTFIFEVSADGSNWQNAEVRLTGNDTWQGGVNQTPTANNIYRVFTVGYRNMRVRTVTTLGSTVAFIATLSAHSPAILATKTGPAPHNFGYTPVHKDVEYTSAQTGTAIWTPASGKKFVVTDITISTGGTTAGIVTIWQGASGDTTYNAGTDPAVFRGEFAPSATVRPGAVMKKLYVSTTADHVLRITTSTAMTIYVQVEGYEI